MRAGCGRWSRCAWRWCWCCRHCRSPSCCFFSFPRIAPLWSVPLPSASSTGISDRMKPGDIAQLTRSDALAFRVVFDGPGTAQARPVLAWARVLPFSGRHLVRGRSAAGLARRRAPRAGAGGGAHRLRSAPRADPVRLAVRAGNAAGANARRHPYPGLSPRGSRPGSRRLPLPCGVVSRTVHGPGRAAARHAAARETWLPEGTTRGCAPTRGSLAAHGRRGVVRARGPGRDPRAAVLLYPESAAVARSRQHRPVLVRHPAGFLHPLRRRAGVHAAFRRDSGADGRRLSGR
jgi:hypothetical protein